MSALAVAAADLSPVVTAAVEGFGAVVVVATPACSSVLYETAFCLGQCTAGLSPPEIGK